LQSVAAQTYSNVEVIVVDDGSTDRQSILALEEAKQRYSHFRFMSQPNSGAASARNRCLTEARGEYFIPVDADNIVRPDMAETFVRGISRNPHLSAMTCYFLAFRDAHPQATREYLFACRPPGGPHTMASLRNIYGDTTSILRTEDFRAVGGYEPDRGTSTEDWEGFVKLVHAGKQVGVIPDHLFEYRLRSASFSRTTNRFANHQRVLRQFTHRDQLLPGEAAVLWSALLGFQQQMEQLTSRQECLRYRLADQVHSLCARVPGATRILKRIVRSAWAGYRRLGAA
jgi:glycosyltransferase involved in cell wall biosynthesis